MATFSFDRLKSKKVEFQLSLDAENRNNKFDKCEIEKDIEKPSSVLR